MPWKTRRIKIYRPKAKDTPSKRRARDAIFTLFTLTLVAVMSFYYGRYYLSAR